MGISDDLNEYLVEQAVDEYLPEVLRCTDRQY